MLRKFRASPSDLHTLLFIIRCAWLEGRTEFLITPCYFLHTIADLTHSARWVDGLHESIFQLWDHVNKAHKRKADGPELCSLFNPQDLLATSTLGSDLLVLTDYFHYGAVPDKQAFLMQKWRGFSNTLQAGSVITVMKSCIQENASQMSETIE